MATATRQLGNQPAVSNTRYILRRMFKKVLISVPVDLLTEFDSLADSLGKTRSGLLQDVMRERIGAPRKLSPLEIKALIDSHRGTYEGDSVRAVKEGRPKH